MLRSRFDGRAPSLPLPRFGGEGWREGRFVAEPTGSFLSCDVLPLTPTLSTEAGERVRETPSSGCYFPTSNSQMPPDAPAASHFPFGSKARFTAKPCGQTSTRGGALVARSNRQSFGCG